MINNIIKIISLSARRLLTNWRTTLLFLVLYAVLLTTLYFFVATRESSMWQLVLTFLLSVGAIFLFFVLQAMGVSYTQEPEASAASLLRKSAQNFWKLILVSIPIALLAWLFIYLFGKLQGAQMTETASTSTKWLQILLTSLRLILFYILLPLTAIHLWIVAARNGLGGTVKRAGRILVRSFAPRALFIYVVGFLLFCVVPYFLLFTRTPARDAWVEMGLLGLRLTLSFLFIVFGWVMTLGSLARNDEV